MPEQVEEDCISLVQPVGYHRSTCGYCSSPSTRGASKHSSASYGSIWPQLSARVYQNLIDRGWRRSGDYVYHPDMRTTCCPQYTIRLDAAQFKPDKKQKKTLVKWNRYLVGEKARGAQKGVPWVKGDKKSNTPYDIVKEVHSSEARIATTSAHNFQVQFTPAEPTAETFALYKRYQMAVHGDPEAKVTPRAFARFLCGSPIVMQNIPFTSDSVPDHLPKQYGSYHQLYRVDGELVAIGVIDILPLCVSSVYLIWDPDWAWASLGKISALHEIALVRDLAEAGAPGMQWLYMGYYIHTCQKMRYKAEYQPSQLLDPGTNVFYPLNKVKALLDKHPRGYLPFGDVTKWAEQSVAPEQAGSKDEDQDDASVGSDDEEAEWPEVDPPSFASPSAFTQEEINNLAVLSAAGVARPFKALPARHRRILEPEIRKLTAAVGLDFIASVERQPSDGDVYLYLG